MAQKGECMAQRSLAGLEGHWGGRSSREVPHKRYASGSPSIIDSKITRDEVVSHCNTFLLVGCNIHFVPFLPEENHKVYDISPLER